MSRALDVVTLTGEEYDDLMKCKEMVTSLLAQLSAAKDRIAELTPVAGMDWRETMQRMLTRMEETDLWPAICDEARAVLSLANDATREPAAYLWGGCLWRTDEMGRGRPGAVELYRAQTPLTDADITALLPIWQQGSWTLPDYGRWVARAVERAHGIKTSHNLCLSCGHSIDAHDRQYGCAEDGCDCETPNLGLFRNAALLKNSAPFWRRKMSEVMTQAIIGMPYEMAMADELSSRQFHDRAQGLLADCAALEAECERLRGEISDLHTTMMAAAVEIQEHWAAHCDEEGYGPANLMHRLERGIASQYGYTAQALVQLKAERDALASELAAIKGQEPAGVVHLRKGGGISMLQVELNTPLHPGTKLYTLPAASHVQGGT